MSQPSRSWIDNLNPRDLEVELANRGLSVQGSADERRRRLRHYERTNRPAEDTSLPTTPIDDLRPSYNLNAQNVVSTNPNLNASHDQISDASTATASSPLNQENVVPNQPRDNQADGAPLINVTENQPPLIGNVSSNRPNQRSTNLGAIPRNTQPSASYTTQQEIRAPVNNTNRNRAESVPPNRLAFTDRVPQHEWDLPHLNTIL